MCEAIQKSISVFERYQRVTHQAVMDDLVLHEHRCSCLSVLLIVMLYKIGIADLWFLLHQNSADISIWFSQSGGLHIYHGPENTCGFDDLPKASRPWISGFQHHVLYMLILLHHELRGELNYCKEP